VKLSSGSRLEATNFPRAVSMRKLSELLRRDQAAMNRLGKDFEVDIESLHLPIDFNPFLAEMLMWDGSLLIDRAQWCVIHWHVPE
jgi:hypothetical protein